jgi:hypothetical protein
MGRDKTCSDHSDERQIPNPLPGIKSLSRSMQKHYERKNQDPGKLGVLCTLGIKRHNGKVKCMALIMKAVSSSEASVNT